MSSKTQKVNPKLAFAKRKEGDQHTAAAEKALQTGFFKWTPDHEVAASEFQKAALAYQLAGLLDLAVKSYKRASFSYIQSKADYSAAKCYEAAAKAENGRKSFSDAAVLYQKAGEYYGNSGYNERMAEILVVASKSWESAGDMIKASNVLEEAISVYEADDKEYNSVEAFKQLSGLYVTMQEFEKTTDVLHRSVKVYESLEQPHNVHSTYFHIIVLLLSQGKGAEANEKLNEFINQTSSFLDSNEFTMASRLIDAVMSDSNDLLEQFIKGNMHNVRERTFAKLIKDMKFIGSSSHSLQVLDDAVEDQLILGTPPRSPRESYSELTGQATDSLPSTEATDSLPPEVTDDDLL